MPHQYDMIWLEINLVSKVLTFCFLSINFIEKYPDLTKKKIMARGYQKQFSLTF